MNRANMAKQITEVPMAGYSSKKYQMGGMVENDMPKRAIRKRGGMGMGPKRPMMADQGDRMMPDQADRMMADRESKMAARSKGYMSGGKVKGYKNGGAVMAGKSPKKCKMA